ncbi:fimbrial protein [Providencia alcalifaciens]|uniref:fimbrial protein n=1 Tax=Providencia alcalifaciens TaxID=126385 RepID=UPI001CE0B16A|nr:fimbrial protein [Providencia alcalifaciens]
MNRYSYFLMALLFVYVGKLFAASNSVSINFDAHLYQRTCDVNLSENVVAYGKVKPQTIVDNDSGISTALNRNVILTLANCSGLGTLSGSKVIVTGPNQVMNGETLFKESGSSGGVGIRLKADGKNKISGDSVWDLSATNNQGNQISVVTALSCGNCQSVQKIQLGTFKATMMFTVLAY